MTPHYVFISPFSSPLSWVFPVTYWFSSAVCIFVSIYFFRAGKGTWWLALALVFAFPLVEGPAFSWHRGIPPFPFALETVVNSPPAHAGFTDRKMGFPDVKMAYTVTKMITTRSSAPSDTYQPLMALAFLWAYIAEKKKRTQSPGS